MTVCPRNHQQIEGAAFGTPMTLPTMCSFPNFAPVFYSAASPMTVPWFYSQNNRLKDRENSTVKLCPMSMVGLVLCSQFLNLWKLSPHCYVTSTVAIITKQLPRVVLRKHEIAASRKDYETLQLQLPSSKNSQEKKDVHLSQFFFSVLLGKVVVNSKPYNASSKKLELSALGQWYFKVCSSPFGLLLYEIF